MVTAGSETRAELNGGGGGVGEETCGRGDGGVGDPRRTCGGGGGVGEETCGRGDGGVGDPRRTQCGGGGRSGGDGEETYGHGNGGVRDPRRTEGGEGEPSGGRARAEEWDRTLEELDESDIRACGGFLPLGRTGLASGTLETENGSGLDSGTRVEEGSDVDAGLGRVLPETGETASGESVTNEANFNEDVNSSNGFTDIGITTNSGVDSGLDKGGIDGDFDGGETECGAAFRVRRPPTAACGGTSPTRGEGRSGRPLPRRA